MRILTGHYDLFDLVALFALVFFFFAELFSGDYMFAHFLALYIILFHCLRISEARVVRYRELSRALNERLIELEGKDADGHEG